MIRVVLLASLLSLSAYESVYYDAWEKFGVHEREILIDRIEEAQDAQEEGQAQFKNALEQFRAVVNFDGGDLEAIYYELNAEYEDSVESADLIRERIDDVESIAEALFDEWSGELDQYSSQSLRRDSEKQLNQTKQRYNRLISSMRKTEKPSIRC